MRLACVRVSGLRPSVTGDRGGQMEAIVEDLGGPSGRRARMRVRARVCGCQRCNVAQQHYWLLY